MLLTLSVLLAGCSTSEPDRVALKEELKREILAELREAPAEDAPPAVPTGDVEGRLIFKEKGVAGCHVKLVRLLEAQTFLGMMKEMRLGAEFEALSDGEGRYAFRGIPIGQYRMFWQVPGDTGWVRRLREKPDAIVEVGKAAKITDVDLSRRPIASDSQ